MQLALGAPRCAAPARRRAAACASACASAAPLRASRAAFAGARMPCSPSGARSGSGALRAGGRSGCGGARTVAAIKKCSKRSVVKAAVLHAEEGQADAVRALCLEHMNAVHAAKARAAPR
jgi:hypothetical protein